MKKKPSNHGLVDEYLRSVEGMKEAETNPFFYTTLKARMENQLRQGWRLPLQPVWMVVALCLLLVINGFIVSEQFRTKEDNIMANSSLQNLASAYDLSIPSTY